MIDIVLTYLNSGRGNERTDEMNRCILDTCQQTLKKTMELNNRYHTPEEIIQIMSDITGEKLHGSFIIFLRFMQILGGTFTSESMYLSIPDAIFRTRAASISVTMF